MLVSIFLKLTLHTPGNFITLTILTPKATTGKESRDRAGGSDRGGKNDIWGSEVVEQSRHFMRT